MSTKHSKAAEKFQENKELAGWHDQTLWMMRAKRDKISREVPEWEQLRDMASAIKMYSNSHLDLLLQEFEKNAQANGAHVYWAKDADEYCSIIYNILHGHNVHRFIKSKSMLAEECGLNEFLIQKGIDVVESDLGERILQLMHKKPSHIVLPASVIGTNGVIVDETPAEGTSALLWAPSPGMKGGQAIAEIILGETEPSGRLPITFPRHAGQLPVYYNQIRGQHGNRYADLTQNPAFAFGEGLSYTTFEYGDPTITNVPESGIFAETDTVHAEITLTNTGDRKGTEVVQLYIGDIVTSYSWTDRELKAFQRVELEPGKSKTVAFDIPVSDCTIVDSEANRIVEPGEFEVLIGHSSRREHLKRTTFTVA